MTTHTPGPWYVAGYGVLGAKKILSDQICVTMTNRSIEERLANAHLIAAAPELLAKLIENHIPHLGVNHIHEKCSTCKLIAKAEGK